MSVVNSHLNELPLKFSVGVKECQDKLPTIYWLPNPHKRPYEARFVANSSSCTITELSKLLTPCLTAVKTAVPILTPQAKQRECEKCCIEI